MWKHPVRYPHRVDEPNDSRVLRTVRDSKSISRTEIAQVCKLSKPTISEIVNRFLKNGFLEIVGESASTDRGGRKRELLRFNPRAGYVVGVDIRMRETHVAITDLNANILVRDSLSYPAGSSPDAVLKDVSRLIDSMLASNRAFMDKCVGIGIGLPGLINRARGVIQMADTLVGWEGVHVRSRFQKRFGVPVYLDNDVKARTLGEYLFGVGKKKLNQVFLWIGNGIGAGIIIDGKLHRGITESAGEVGYNELLCEVKSKALFPLMYNGQRDFGDILSNSMIAERYAAHAHASKHLSVGKIFRRAENGDRVAQQILEETAELTSFVCIDLINTLNPELIILGGEIVESGTAMLERIQEKVHKDILHAPVEAVHVAASVLKDDGVILGAVGLVLYELFKPARIETPEAVLTESSISR